MDDLTRRREEKQPLEYGSAGSTFKRPEGFFAGKLITDAGLKGYRVGDAAVSTKHAGFVVNLGHATSKDVHAVIEHVQDEVLKQSGVFLEPEVRFL
jgi:UDP-N-acetylmuramate dehydrogenase